MFIDIFASMAHTENGLIYEIINTDFIQKISLKDDSFSIYFTNCSPTIFNFVPDSQNHDSFREIFVAISKVLVKDKENSLVLYPQDI